MDGHRDPKFETIVRIAHACGEHVGEQPFSLSGEQRAKVRTAAGIPMDLTGGRSIGAAATDESKAKKKRRREWAETLLECVYR